VGASLLYLSRADVEAVALDMPTAIGLLERAFREKAAGRTEMPPKPGIHPRPDAFIHAMPAHIPALGAAGIKWVSGFPANTARGLPYVSGLLVLNDDDTGLPTAVMDCTWITGCRTGAASALSARFLARPASRTLGVLGCGVQGRTHLEAFRASFPIADVLAYDTTRATAERYAEEMTARHGVPVRAVATPREAVAESDLVVTAGPIRKEPTPTIPAGWLRAGAFASAVDFDSYWTPEALAEVDHLSTDEHAQFGYYRDLGYFRRTPAPHSDLGEIVSGAKAGRTDDRARMMAMNLGLAIDDMAVAPEIVRRAKAKGIGTELAL
jgi:ornithine cyclodeaminase/alanine dehydrogenase-like protein (mu-crystallin family)